MANPIRILGLRPNCPPHAYKRRLMSKHCPQWIAMFAGIILVGSWMGCDQSEPLDSHVNPMVSTKASSSTSLQQGLDLLAKLEESNTNEAYRRIQQYLQEWIAQQPEDKDWAIDPMVERLPATFQPLVTKEQLAQRAIEPYDILILRESLWLRDIARSTLQRSQLVPGLEERIAQTAASSTNGLAEDLTNALKLFDWTVLNLQLDPDFSPGQEKRFQSDLTLYPWESLLMGRGTLEEKSRVFSLLARQVRLPVVMLALDRPDAPSPIPWTPALHVGDQLYLLDMQLGAPLPDRSGSGILTLSKLIEDPSQLEALAVSTDEPYRVRPEDLSYVIAWTDATPADMSQRMKLLEAALLGDDKMTLTASPSEQAAAIGAMPGIQRVEIWPLPYRTFAQRATIDPNSPPIAELSMEHSLFERRPMLMLARIQHFRGNYESSEDQMGARAMYMGSRVPEDELAKIKQTPIQLPPNSPPPTEQDKAMHARRLEILHSLMRRTKQNASYWLGLMAFDRGDYPVAVDFLEKRLLAIEPQTVWTAGAHYALARSYEAWGLRDNKPDLVQKAVQLYRDAPKSTYTAANLWRANQLEKNVATP